MAVGRSAVDAISRRYGTSYVLGSTASALCEYNPQIYIYLKFQIDWLQLPQ